MGTRYLDIATTPSVAAANEHYVSPAQWARMGARGHAEDAGQRERLGPPELAFIAARRRAQVATIRPVPIRTNGATTSLPCSLVKWPTSPCMMLARACSEVRWRTDVM